MSRVRRAKAGAVLAVAVLGIAVSAPLIAATSAPAIAIAFWRTAAGAAAFAALVASTTIRARRCRPAKLSGGEARFASLAGLCLAGHFATWIPSLGLTTVAASTALVCTQPVWATLIVRITGVRIGPGVWTGSLIAVLGVLAMVGTDMESGRDALFGNALALAGGLFGAGYVVLGQRARITLDTARYNMLAFTTAAGALAAVAAATHTPLVGFTSSAWWGIAAVTLTGQILGHALLNHSLKTIDATTVSTVALLEVPAATALAALFLAQYPPWVSLIGATLVAIGVALVIRSRPHLAS
ncbi:DMT family transporter [Rhodococcus sp. NPDC076796]|uniref:DMT family transporter n=1 Tax=Rhodococcus sp. NPDC076796 TaxID=3154859 RepID=UPI00344D8959